MFDYNKKFQQAIASFTQEFNKSSDMNDQELESAWRRVIQKHPGIYYMVDHLGNNFLFIDRFDYNERLLGFLKNKANIDLNFVGLQSGASPTSRHLIAGLQSKIGPDSFYDKAQQFKLLDQSGYSPGAIEYFKNIVERIQSDKQFKKCESELFFNFILTTDDEQGVEAKVQAWQRNLKEFYNFSNFVDNLCINSGKKDYVYSYVIDYFLDTASSHRNKHAASLIDWQRTFEIIFLKVFKMDEVIKDGSLMLHDKELANNIVLSMLNLARYVLTQNVVDQKSRDFFNSVSSWLGKKSAHGKINWSWPLKDGRCLAYRFLSNWAEIGTSVQNNEQGQQYLDFTAGVYQKMLEDGFSFNATTYATPQENLHFSQVVKKYWINNLSTTSYSQMAYKWILATFEYTANSIDILEQKYNTQKLLQNSLDKADKEGVIKSVHKL